MKTKKLVALLLCAVILVNTACKPKHGVVDVTLSFAGETDGRLEAVYTGSERVIEVSTDGHNVNYTITYSLENGKPLEKQPVDAGNYKVKATVSQEGYRGSREISFIITPKPITLSANNQEFTAGAAYEPFNWLKDLPEGMDSTSVDITYKQGQGEYTPLKPSDPGLYTVKFVIASGNFIGEYEAQFKINANVVEDELQLNGLSKIYNGSEQGVTVDGLFGKYYYGEPVIRYNGSTERPTDAGSYAVTAAIPVAGVNDVILNGTLEIQKKAVNIAAQDKGLSIGDEVEHDDVYFDDSGIVPLVEDIIISYEKWDDDKEKFVAAAGIDTENIGEYRVTFSVNHLANFSGSETAIYKVARLGIGVTWNDLTQIYQDDNSDYAAVTFVKGDFQEFKSMTFKGAGSTVYEESDVQPVNAGAYEVTLTLETDGVIETVTASFTIQPRKIQLTAENKFFLLAGSSVTIKPEDHTAARADGGTLPSFAVSYKYKETGAPVSGVPSQEGVYIAVFTVTDSNYEQVGQCTAEYFIAEAGQPYIRNSAAAYDGTAKPVDVLGYNVTTQSVAVTYQFIEDGQGKTPTGTAAEPTGAAPVKAGRYEVAVTLFDGIGEEAAKAGSYTFDYTIYRKTVTITRNSATTLDCTTSAIRAAASNSSGGTGSTVTFQVSFSDNTLNSAAVNTRRSYISRITVESIELADGSVYGPVVSETNGSGGNVANNYAATNAGAQIPANAKAGTYKITYEIDLPDYEGVTEIIYTLKAREGTNAAPSGTGGLSPGYGDPVNVSITLRNWQQFIDGEPFYYGGTGETEYELSDVPPIERGTYAVTRRYRSDGVTMTWEGTLTIGQKALQLAPQNKTVAYHTLGGAPIPIVFGDIGLPSGLTPLGTPVFEDFNILFYKYEDGIPSSQGTSAPSLPGVYRVEFKITNPDSNFKIGNTGAVAAATYEITARTGLIYMPGHTYVLPGSQVPPVQTQAFHLNALTVYEGVGSTGYGPSETAPAGIGDYKVTFTCTTDTVNEEYIGYLHISAIVNTELPELILYSPDGYLFPPMGGANAGNWLEYTFKYALDGSETVKRLEAAPVNMKFKPGDYTFKVVTEGGVSATASNGSFTVEYDAGSKDAIIDAVGYGEYYYENVATDVATNFYGNVPTSLGILGPTTVVNTMRYKTSNSLSDIKSWYRTSSNSSYGLADIRFAMEAFTIGASDVYYRVGYGANAFTSKSGSAGVVFATNAAWNGMEYTKTDKAGYTFNQGDPVPGTPHGGFGMWFEELSPYTVNSETINLDSANTQFFRDAGSGNYTARIQLNEQAHNAGLKQQIKANSNNNGPWQKWTNTHLTIDIDKYGRVSRVATTDYYYVDGLLSAEARLTGVEFIVYGKDGKFLDKDGTWTDTYLKFFNEESKKCIELVGYLMYPGQTTGANGYSHTNAQFNNANTELFTTAAPKNISSM